MGYDLEHARRPLSLRLTELLLFLEERRGCGLTLQPESVQGLARLFADMIEEARGLEEIVDLAEDALDELRAERATAAAVTGGASLENVVAFPAAARGRPSSLPRGPRGPGPDHNPDPKGAA
jgi:hypothetical protein